MIRLTLAAIGLAYRAARSLRPTIRPAREKTNSYRGARRERIFLANISATDSMLLDFNESLTPVCRLRTDVAAPNIRVSTSKLSRKARSDFGPAAPIRRVLLTRLLPAVIVIPLVLSWLRQQGERAGFYSASFGVSL